jgi:hypothetical protein
VAPVLDKLLGSWLPWVLLFVVVPMVGRGGTPGQRAVLLRPALRDGAVPSPIRLGARSVLGVGGFVLLHAAGLDAVAGIWGLVSLVGIVTTADRRGVAGVLTSTVLVDRRPSAPPYLGAHVTPGGRARDRA